MKKTATGDDLSENYILTEVSIGNGKFSNNFKCCDALKKYFS